MSASFEAPAGEPAASTVVVMGVAGCGKSTIGQLLADRLGMRFAESDAFHPPGNVAKMSDGIPLTDQDRQPWLEAIADRIGRDGHLVVSCSALKRVYRDVLRTADPRAWFLHLSLDKETARARVANRTSHFMPSSLVDSQFDALEPLHCEAGLTVDAALLPEEILSEVLSVLPRSVIQ